MRCVHLLNVKHASQQHVAQLHVAAVGGDDTRAGVELMQHVLQLLQQQLAAAGLLAARV